MNPYTGRLLGYVCLSLFLAFVAGPYTGQKMVSKTEPVVYLSAVALSTSAQRLACLEGIKSVSEKDLTSFPKIRKALSFLSRSPIETNQVSLYGGNLEAFIKGALGQSQREFCFEYNERTFKLVWLIIRDMGSLYLVSLNEPPSVPSLAKSDLSKYPEMAAYMRDLEGAAQEARELHREDKTEPTGSPSGGSVKTLDDATKLFEQIKRQVKRRRLASRNVKQASFYRSERIQMGWDEWADLNKTLGTSPEKAVFRIGDYLIIGFSEELAERVPTDIQWFRISRYLFGAIFLFFGLYAMWGIYKKRPGINLNPGWAAIIGDGIFILFVGFGAYCLIEYGMGKYFAMTSFLGDEVVRSICSIAYLPVTAFCALFAANQFNQSVEVENEGLRLHYPDGSKVLAWQDIQGFDLKESYTVVGRGGIMLPRKLQTKLIIQTTGGMTSLVEPGFKETKRKLISTIKDKAPERLQSDLEKVTEEW
ncbi:MAG: DUF308 domain-containing protein [Desulfobacteraceae bacterium]|nr:DUF308 domain-containing protein [Desulfobacteraceae bacterium]